MSEETKLVDDLIIENMAASKNAVMQAFNVTNVKQLAGWERVVAAMRGLPTNLMTDIGIPLIQKSFMVYGFDPHTEQGREEMKPFQDVIALALQDAMTLIMQNIQRSNQTAEVLRQGQGGLLRQ